MITREQLDDAMMMIDHAVRRGLDVPQDILGPILDAKEGLQQGT